MRLLYVFAYLAVEIGAFALMVSTLGFGWAILITLAAGLIGMIMLQRQGRKIFAELRQASRNEVDARRPLTDTALLAAATVLLVVPGVVTSAVGILALLPPVRAALRPVIAAVGARKFVAAMNKAGVAAGGTIVGGPIVDGTVVDGSPADRARRTDTTGSAASEVIIGELPRGR
ncbi:FxsA family protein [Gordonia soli]|uniref:FxsA protein n=1 Tax=Gordonia soli NBRC 108243 TaxID=1223545 RepID=M0QRR5_9ACTN|nr:FxsA family protein [Gordonia soli]GAC70267.1 hypothetical protein GS4_33_00820 [Gordonia soli NBRC 108243]